jgi:hypothetical protein
MNYLSLKYMMFRCNMFSHALILYQNTLVNFWEKTAKTMNHVNNGFKVDLRHTYPLNKGGNLKKSSVQQCFDPHWGVSGFPACIIIYSSRSSTLMDLDTDFAKLRMSQFCIIFNCLVHCYFQTERD